MPEHINLPELPKPLKGKDLNVILNSVSKERGLEPSEVDRFLKLDPETARPLSKMDIIYPSATVVTHLLTKAAFDTHFASPGPELTPFLHNFLQAVYAMADYAAASPALRDHLPYLSLVLGTTWGFKNTLPKWLRGDSFVGKVSSAQEKVKGKVSSGEMKYKMGDRHTAAFVGKGDLLADALQKEKGESMVMKYADVPITEQVWQLIKSNGSQEEIFKALDRADFAKAGEVLILPVKAEDMILPGPEGHDMTLDEIAAKIKISAEYCKTRNIDQKRIVVVGDLDHQEVYSQRTGERKAETKIKTLRDLLREVKGDLKSQGMDIEIVSADPTEDTMVKVANLAGGRKVEYHATRQSDERYGKRFYRELKKLNYKINPAIEGTSRVFYNITDIPTEMNIDSDDIAIVLDKSVKDRLVAGGFNPQNIICPPEDMQKKLSLVVDQT